MKLSIRPIGLAALVLVGAAACAQQPPLPPGPTPAAPPPIADAAAASSVTGRVQRWLINPNGDVDGLLLADGTQVGFPPHLSDALLQLLKAGDSVRIAGWCVPGVPVMHAASLTAAASGNSVIDQPPGPGMVRPRDPGSLTAMSANGHVARVLYTDRGDANGVLLDSGEIVRFPPGAGLAMPTMLQVGATLSARGWGTRNAQGSALEATALGASPDTLQELFAGPGRARPPGGPRPLPPSGIVQPPPPPAS